MSRTPGVLVTLDEFNDAVRVARRDGVTYGFRQQVDGRGWCTTRGAPPIPGPGGGSPKSPQKVLLSPQSW